MISRAHINGRHFDLMRRLIEGDAELPLSDALVDLLKWGYAQREGAQYAASNAGHLAWDTWQNMRIE